MVKSCLTLALCMLLAGLAGCASTGTDARTFSSAQARALLEQHVWQLTRATDRDGERIESLFARAHEPLQLEFHDGRIHVANACNVLNGEVVIEHGTLRVKQMISTMMACADPAVRGLDDAISSRLSQTDALDLDSDATPPTLTLTTPDKDTLVFDAVRGSD